MNRRAEAEDIAARAASHDELLELFRRRHSEALRDSYDIERLRDSARSELLWRLYAEPEVWPVNIHNLENWMHDYENSRRSILNEAGFACWAGENGAFWLFDSDLECGAAWVSLLDPAECAKGKEWTVRDAIKHALGQGHEVIYSRLSHHRLKWASERLSSARRRFGVFSHHSQDSVA